MAIAPGLGALHRHGSVARPDESTRQEFIVTGDRGRFTLDHGGGLEIVGDHQLVGRSAVRQVRVADADIGYEQLPLEGVRLIVRRSRGGGVRIHIQGLGLGQEVLSDRGRHVQRKEAVVVRLDGQVLGGGAQNGGRVAEGRTDDKSDSTDHVRRHQNDRGPRSCRAFRSARWSCRRRSPPCC